MHALAWQAACAFATLVEHFVPQAAQLFGSLVVSTHAPEQFVGVLPEQPLTHVELAQAGVPASALQACPHDPQLPLSVVVLTQAPLQSVYPLLHAKPQAPPEQVTWALATFVVHLFPQAAVPQFSGSVCLSTHAPPHRDCPDGQPETHAAAPPASAPDAEQTGVPASALQATPHKPQLALVLSCTQAPLHSVYPALHETVHALFTHTGSPFGSVVVHTWAPPSAPAHPPQAVAVLVVSTQDPLQSVCPEGQPETHA